MAALAFTKMHGCGNDFVVLDGRAAPLELSGAQIRRLADRHKGVGFDQLVVLENAPDADLGLRFFNSDGSGAGACGNGTRCAARLLFEQGVPGRIVIRIGDRRLVAERQGDGWIAVEMGTPGFDWRKVPLAEPCDSLAVPIDHPELPPPAAVDMGNPHLVFVVDDLAALDVARLGGEIQRHPLLPASANVGFAQLLADDLLRLRVYERGAGLTLACGSGACAAMVAARRRGLVENRARLILDGGELEIVWPGEGPVTMIGPTAKVFSGTLEPELLNDDGC
jgi:diaminopimelate epimerase